VGRQVKDKVVDRHLVDNGKVAGVLELVLETDGPQRRSFAALSFHLSTRWVRHPDALTFIRLVEHSGKVNMVVEDQLLDRTYSALADPTRRALLVALRTGDARITDLARPIPMSFAGVSRHVAVLETAGLVTREVRGRDHWLSLRPEGLSGAERWINDQTTFWSKRADALAARIRANRTRRG
jgi:DNA-binding transcriptional ArsR family regulator